MIVVFIGKGAAAHVSITVVQEWSWLLTRNNADRDKRCNPARKKHCVMERNLRSYDIRNTHCSFLYLG